jgi:hypothetical protein
MAEFQALIPPLGTEEAQLLEASLLAEGCREPLTVWDSEAGQLLLDGHHRYAICQRHALPYTTQPIALDSRAEAINWLINHQLGRRNLTEEQKSYLRGKRYNLEKRQDGGHGVQKAADRSDPPMTAQRLAQEYQVGEATIKRDGQFATALDTLEQEVRADIREIVLTRQRPDAEPGDSRRAPRITKAQVIDAGKLLQAQQVQPLPFMQRESWKPHQVLEAIELLG